MSPQISPNLSNQVKLIEQIGAGFNAQNDIANTGGSLWASLLVELNPVGVRTKNYPLKSRRSRCELESTEGSLLHDADCIEPTEKSLLNWAYCIELIVSSLLYLAHYIKPTASKRVYSADRNNAAERSKQLLAPIF